MHDCPNCEAACDCDMEDHYQEAPDDCDHECDEDEDFDDEDY
jgi:hypothetical protein